MDNRLTTETGQGFKIDTGQVQPGRVHHWARSTPGRFPGNRANGQDSTGQPMTPADKQEKSLLRNNNGR